VSGSSGAWERLLGFMYDYEISNTGTIVFSGSIYSLLAPWMINLTSTFNAYSDGFSFGFIPVQSSFDYQADDPTELDFDIFSEPISNTIARTPFHAVNTSRFVNRSHMNVTNPNLLKYSTCDDDAITAYLMTREIGDDTLWLENVNTVPGGGIFEAEQYLGINFPNPYYNYPTANSADPDFGPFGTLAYVISREDPVYITDEEVTFRANDLVDINGSVPLFGDYLVRQGDMKICCENFVQRPFEETRITARDKSKSILELYPNPTRGIITVRYKFGSSGLVNAKIFNLQGQEIETITMPFSDNIEMSYFTINLSKSKLPPGIYTLKLENKKESHYKKFAVIE
jgi:hypothetical protein